MNTQDIRISVDLEVLCTKTFQSAAYKAMSVQLDGFEIIDLIKKIPMKECEITDQWIQEGMDEVESVCVDLEFEVTFDSDGELDDVCLCCESIIDIVTDKMEDEIYTIARANFISENEDRAYEEYKDRILEGYYDER